MTLCSHCNTPMAGARCPHCSSSSSPTLILGAALLALGLSACDGGSGDSAVVALYGAPDTGYVDADGDGTRANLDCDDENADIYPGAPETAGDGVDSNCDGEDDT